MEYDKEDIKIDGLTEEEDIQSQSTFRTRTDSSSIGDYESHSSDYDDEFDIVNEEKVQGCRLSITISATCRAPVSARDGRSVLTLLSPK